MKAIICAACRKLLGYDEQEHNNIEDLKALAIAHKASCPATEAEYEQALIDLKFQNITKGLGL